MTGSSSCSEHMRLRRVALDAQNAHDTSGYWSAVHQIDRHCAECPTCNPQGNANRALRMAREREAVQDYTDR